MKHIFPFSEIEKGRRIILYGASERGYDFYRQLVSTGYCEVVLWVDRQYEWYRYMGLPVDAPERIADTQYDLIVLTAETEKVFQSMKADLLRIGVKKDRIFWKEECLIKGNVALGYDENRVSKEAENAYRMDPDTFINSDRLDIVVRILYARDILAEENDESHRELYLRVMMIQNDGGEPTENMISAFFSDYALKRGRTPFDTSFRALIASMKDNGFRREKFIPLDRKKRMINGAHRLAASVALGIEIWAYTYPVEVKPLVFDAAWFLQNGFSHSEVTYLSEKYMELVG